MATFYNTDKYNLPTLADLEWQMASCQIRFEWAEKEWQNAKRDYDNATARLAVLAVGSENYCHARDKARQAERDMQAADEDANRILASARELRTRYFRLARVQAGWAYRFARRDAGLWA